MNETTTEIISAGIVKGFEKLIEISVPEHGWYLVFLILAILGVISILSAIFSKALDAIGIFIKIFIFLPAILILNLVNKKKRKERLKAWGELKEDLNKSDKKISKKMWVFWLLVKIVLPIMAISYLIFGVFL